MLSFKDYKKHILNESFGGAVALGLTNPTNMGIVGGVGGTEAALKEKLMAIKERAKFKFGKPPVDDEEEEDESGDGEVVDAASEKDEPDVDVDMDMDDEGGDDCGFCKKSGKKSAKKSVKKMSKMKKMCGDDLEDAEEETGEDLDGDDEEGEDPDHVAAVKGGGDEEEDEEGDGGVEMPDDAVPLFSKKKSGKKSGKKMKAEQTEEEKWMASVTDMLSIPVMKFGDGWTEYQEDALVVPAAPKAPKAPAPGEPGFAPTGRIGSPLGGDDLTAYYTDESLAITLIDAGVDVEMFCEQIEALGRQKKLTEENLDELWRNILGGVSPLASAAAGAANVGGALGKWAGRKVGNAASAVGNAAMDAGRAGMDMAGRAAGAVADAGRAVGGAAADAGRAVANKAGEIGANVRDTYRQGRSAEDLKQASNLVSGLQQRLSQLGYPQDFLAKAVEPLQRMIAHDMEQNKQKGYKMGSEVSMSGPNKYRIGKTPPPAAAGGGAVGAA